VAIRGTRFMPKTRTRLTGRSSKASTRIAAEMNLYTIGGQVRPPNMSFTPKENSGALFRNTDRESDKHPELAAMEVTTRPEPLMYGRGLLGRFLERVFHQRSVGLDPEPFHHSIFVKRHRSIRNSKTTGDLFHWIPGGQ